MLTDFLYIDVISKLLCDIMALSRVCFMVLKCLLTLSHIIVPIYSMCYVVRHENNYMICCLDR